MTGSQNFSLNDKEMLKTPFETVSIPGHYFLHIVLAERRRVNVEPSCDLFLAEKK